MSNENFNVLFLNTFMTTCIEFKLCTNKKRKKGNEDGGCFNVYPPIHLHHANHDMHNETSTRLMNRKPLSLYTAYRGFKIN